MRAQTLGDDEGTGPSRSLQAAGMEPEAVERLFRLLAIAKYDERYVIPQTHGEAAGGSYERQGAVGVGPGAAPASFTRRLL